MDACDGPPWVEVPERLDRRLRLGPFASGRDAVKFVTAAAVGAVVSLAVVPWAGLPIVGVGALVALWRPDGEPLDERVAAVARWSLRRAATDGPPMTAAAAGRSADLRATVPLPDGRSAAVVRTGGVPLAFLPPAELARQFELYRQLLRSVAGGVIVLSTSVPIYAGAVVPSATPTVEVERAAWDGYRELVVLLARRRSVRRVLVAVAQDATTPDRARQLETSIRLLRERLADLGVRSERLRDRSLADGARRLGLLEGATHA